MLIADDPLLACIVRFVSATDGSQPDNDDFLSLQIKTLKKHLLQFPPEEQDDAAMEWVMQHAANYRRYWQQRTISRQTWALRCGDCPVADRAAAEHCEIHEQWLYLLRRYMQGEIRSRDYVEGALALLQGHKDALIRRRSQPVEGDQHELLKKNISKPKKQKKGAKKKRKKKQEQDAGSDATKA